MQLADYRVLETKPSSEIMAYDVLSLPWNSLVKQFKMHADSFSYQILKTDFSVTNAPVVKHNEGEPIYDLVMGEIAKLEAELNATAKMAVLLKLPVGGVIKPHADTSEFFKFAHRCHLPIVTNAGCVFTFGSNGYNFKHGVWHEINNTAVHSFVNNGSTDRIHLVVDLMPNA